MRNNKLMMTVTLGALSLLSCQLYAQQQADPNQEVISKSDSLEITRKEARAREARNESTIAAYEHDRKQTKAKAKNAQRVEDEANTAARESRNALRSERRAQKARKNADRQAIKASKARVLSDRN